MSRVRAEHPFRFCSEVSLVELTGLRARNLRELLSAIQTVPGAVIYHHTHHFLKQHQFLSPEPPNDFAYWVTEVLGDRALGERLAAIDTVRFNSLRALRDKLAQVISDQLSRNGSGRAARKGDEFYFMRSKSFVLPTPFEAFTLEEFSDALTKVSLHSIYHHVFEARLRLERGTNDFANWFENELGESELARRLAGLDPYTHTLEALRRYIVAQIEQRLSETAREPVK